MSPTNLYGEEWNPPSPPLVNISPDAWSKLRDCGFTDWLADDSRDGVNSLITWYCDRAIQLAEYDGAPAFYDRQGNLVFSFAFRDSMSGATSLWKLTFELLDERVSYYDVLRIERMD